MRVGVVAWALGVMLGCSASPETVADGGPDGAADGGDAAADGGDAAALVLGPDGAAGICCPMDEPTCDCFSLGGWAPSLSQCPNVCDLAPTNYETVEDPYGCETYEFADPSGFCFGMDGGS